jgi:glycerol-3-phosphate dehydrogenase (NAD(P)+)
MSRIIVLVSGAWGTALALSLHRRGGHQVSLWAHSPELARQINDAGENTLFLPGFPIPAGITVTGDDAAVADAEIVLSVVPSEFLRATMTRLGPHLHPGQIVVSASKGIENQSLLRMTQVIAACLDERRLSANAMQSLPSADRFNPEPTSSEGTTSLAAEKLDPSSALYQGTTSVVPQARPSEPGALAPEGIPIGALSGPSFALEVAQGQPTALTVAFDDPAVAARIQQEFSSESLRLYTSTDVIGVELGGALKNVIAIAAGVAAGVGLGHNSAAALITRGIAEITRLAVACGGRRETLAGLSGVGDLVLTCTGSLSRNRTVGQELGQGRKLPEILAGLGGKVAEGVLTTRAALGLARQQGIEMPIAEQMEQILNEGKDPREAIKTLMLRPGKDEL